MPVSSAEIELIDRARSGDIQAIELIVSRWEPRIRRFAARLCPATEILDAVQETLLTLSTKIHSLKSAEALSSWSFQIVKRYCIKVFSRFRKDTALAQELAYLDPGISEDNSDRNFLVAELGKILASLPAKDREILFLKDIDDISIKDCARRLNLGESAIKNRLHRARQNLRQRMVDSVAVSQYLHQFRTVS